MQLYTAIKEFYIGNIYYRNSFDFTRISIGEEIGVLSSSPSLYVKGKVVPGLLFPSAYDNLVAGAVVPDPSTGGGVSPDPVTVPISSDAEGKQGSWAFDGTYYYWCVADNQWVRLVVEKLFP